MKMFLGLLVSVAFTTIALAVPQQINYQGHLTRPNGTPLDTTVAITFTLYGTAAGGSMLWQETRTAVLVQQGLFNVILGSSTTLNDTILNRPEVWLGIRVGSDAEMTPRTRVLSVGYSYRVGTVEGASGGTVTGDMNIVGKTNLGLLNTNGGSLAHVTGSRGTASGECSTISGGDTNTASASYATVGGGGMNRASGVNATVAGGSHNTASGAGGMVGGGAANTAGGENATVGGGWRNQANGFESTISGGQDNTASGPHFATIGGGLGNQASGWGATVSGGGSDTASGNWATVNGGGNNTASGDAATVVGGWWNTASGQWSCAIGRQAKAVHDGAFVWADGGGYQTDFSSTGLNQFLIRAHGGVGIGTNSPQAQLDVAGTTRTGVLAITGGSDLAEPFPMHDKDVALPPGSLVVIDEEHPGWLKLSSIAYDTKVAGVVSGAGGITPGLTLNQENALGTGQNVALNGRVYALVDASNGPVQPGDLLTTSSLPGHAMKATDRERLAGAVIGKAMGSLDSGQGLVLVLVNLQ